MHSLQKVPPESTPQNLWAHSYAVFWWQRWGTGCSILEDIPLSQHWPGHCQPLHGHCPRAHKLTGFVSADSFSPPHPSCAGLEAAGRKLVGYSKGLSLLVYLLVLLTTRRAHSSHCEHLLCQGAEEMLIQRRRASNHQMWGTISRCWGNVSLP